jgi:hypothetical protein
MIRWTRLSNCTSGAIMITSFGVLFYSEGGDILVLPGLIAQIFLNVFFFLINKDDNWFVAPHGTYLALNVLVYAPLLYFFTVFCILIQTSMKETRVKRSMDR